MRKAKYHEIYTDLPEEEFPNEEENWQEYINSKGNVQFDFTGRVVNRLEVSKEVRYYDDYGQFEDSYYDYTYDNPFFDDILFKEED